MQVGTYLSTKVLNVLANLFIVWHVSITTDLIGGKNGVDTGQTTFTLAPN